MPETLCRNGRCKDFFAHGQPGGRINCCIEPAIGPDGMDAAVESYDPLVVSILIASIGERIIGAFVAHSRRHLHIGSEGQAAVGRLTEENVGLDISRIIAGIVPAQVFLESYGIHREPLIELIFAHTCWIVVDTYRCTPACTAI